MKISIPIQKKADINMIPLMDSMFLLLVFFIYAMVSMVVQHSIPVDLPQAVTSVIKTTPPTTISISENGNYYIDKHPVTRNDLFEKLSNIKKLKQQPNILIQADGKAEHQMIMFALDQCRKADILSIAFETKESIE